MSIDIEKRKRVMRRSIKLGHCICNPKQGCPCDTFKEKDLCPCAGERAEQAVEDVRLTSLVEKAGCASKINQNDLKLVLQGLPDVDDPRLLVGSNTCDDAGVYALENGEALVQTVDVFTPGVDDPYTFGQIAAANSLSDVYAMGGKPITALSVIGFPIETLSHRVMTQILRGGMDKMREAGVAIVGGHSVNDKDLKFGYAVTGLIRQDAVVTNAGAQPGDLLVLTKPLGVGIISFAAQLGRASEAAMAAAASSMTTLNRTAAEAMVEIGVNSATDVTGFGLMGHLGEMAAQSGVTAEVFAGRIPVLPEALDYVYQGMISGGVERNLEFSSQRVTVGDGVSEEVMQVLYDPQTSGGLLISVLEEKAGRLLDALHGRGIDAATVIGRITGRSEGRVVVLSTDREVISTTISRSVSMADSECECGCCCGDAAKSEESCCAPTTGGGAVSPLGMKRKFTEFMGEVNSDGAISVRTKELIAIALSVLSKCEPCVKIHLNKARRMGISEAEISEAVWMAISFGGAPTMMFYNSVVGE